VGASRTGGSATAQDIAGRVEQTLAATTVGGATVHDLTG
jgi:hypothetical protein